MHLGNFLWKPYHQELIKIAQSGGNGQFLIFPPKKLNINKKTSYVVSFKQIWNANESMDYSEVFRSIKTQQLIVSASTHFAKRNLCQAKKKLTFHKFVGTVIRMRNEKIDEKSIFDVILF